MLVASAYWPTVLLLINAWLIPNSVYRLAASFGVRVDRSSDARFWRNNHWANKAARFAVYELGCAILYAVFTFTSLHAAGMMASIARISVPMLFGLWLFLESTSTRIVRDLGTKSFLQLRGIHDDIVRFLGRWAQRSPVGPSPAILSKDSVGPNAISTLAAWMVLIATVSSFGISRGPVTAIKQYWEGQTQSQHLNSAPTSASPTPKSRAETPPTEKRDAAEVTAAEFCGYDPAEPLLQLIPTRVGLGLARAYVFEGAREIGCPDRGVVKRGGLFVARLYRGETAALLVSDRIGRASVIFSELIDVVDGLIDQGSLARVGPRVSWGRGDYYILHTDQSCQLAMRHGYRGPYTVLPSWFTRRLMSLAVTLGGFPLVSSSEVTGREMFYSASFLTPALAETPRVQIGRQPEKAVFGMAINHVGCSGETRLQAIAEMLHRSVARNS